MSKTNQGLVEFAKSKIGTPYIYGAKGELVTQAKFTELKKNYGSYVLDSDAAKIGKICCDCSGLISWYTGVLRNSTDFHNVAKQINPISTVASAPVGALVWHQGHIGIYIGLEDGVPMYIAEDDSKNNCRKNKISAATFTNWFLCTDITYDDAGQTATPVTKGGVIAAGDTVMIKPGAVYGGLSELTKGLTVPPSVIARTHTVAQVARGEALLREINSWVALDYLTRQ